MATLTIRDLDDALKRSLRVRAARQNRSMEEEARQILRAALTAPPARVNLAERIRTRFAGLGDVQLPIEQRQAIRPSPPLPDAPRAKGKTASALGKPPARRR